MTIKRNILLMYAIAFLQGMVFYGPIATLYRRAAGISVFQITVIESISLVLCLMLEVPWGAAAEKIGYKNTMRLCCTLYFLSKIVFWRADSFSGFLLERVMLSVVIAGLSGVDSSILYLSCDGGETQRVFGIYSNLQTAGLLFAAAVYAGWIGNDYRLAGLCTVCSYGLAALLSFGLAGTQKNVSTEEPGVRPFLAVLSLTVKNKRLLLLPVSIALFGETCQMITVFLNQLQYTKCGLSDAQIGYVYILVTLAGMLGVFSHRLTRKLGEKTFALTLFGMAAAACAVLAVTGNAIASVLAVAALRISGGLFQPLQMELQNRQVLTRNRATELSVNAAIIDSVSAGVNVAYGKLADRHLASAMAAGAVFCMISCVLFFIWRKSRQVPDRSR